MYVAIQNREGLKFLGITGLRETGMSQCALEEKYVGTVPIDAMPQSIVRVIDIPYSSTLCVIHDCTSIA